jgi:hypothetical protein
MNFDPDIMATVPYFLSPIDPWVELNKDILMQL